MQLLKLLAHAAFVYLSSLLGFIVWFYAFASILEPANSRMSLWLAWPLFLLGDFCILWISWGLLKTVDV